MAAPIVLRSTDIDAPVLTGEDGSGYDVIKWAAQKLGWSVEFDDQANSKLVIRSSAVAGPGRYYRFRDQAADHGGDGRHMAVESFSSMSDIDTGVDGYPATDGYWVKSAAASSAARDYIIIGTDRHLWFLPDAEGGGRARVFFCGDYAPYAGSDVQHAALLSVPAAPTDNDAASGLCGIAYTSTTDNLASLSRSTIPECLAQTLDGLTIGIDADPCGPSPNISTSRALAGAVGTYPNNVTGAINTSRIELAEAAYGGDRRGQLVGVLNPMSDIRLTSQSDYDTGDTVSSIANGGGQIVDALFVGYNSYLIVDSNADRNGALLFDITTDWDNW